MATAPWPDHDIDVPGGLTQPVECRLVGAHLIGLARVERRTIITRGVAGLVPYLVATVLAPVSSYLTLAICAAVAVFYALPFASASEGTTGPPRPRGSRS